MNKVDVKQNEHHSKYYQEILSQGPVAIDGFINPESIWYWMHVHCLDWIKVFFQGIPKSTFLTVGDGYCGREGGYIKRFGHYVHASDRSPFLIGLAKERGLVDDYSKQDLNRLEFEDESFDFVFTKETLHHMSNPYIGLYEMLRVAKKGVILIEPNGDNGPRYDCDTFEPTGNFLFMFSSHELMKIGAAFGYDYFVISYSIVFYGPHDGDAIARGEVEQEKLRLLEIDRRTELIHKPLLIFFFLKDKETYDVFNDPSRFIKKEVRRPCLEGKV